MLKFLALVLVFGLGFEGQSLALYPSPCSHHWMMIMRRRGKRGKEGGHEEGE